MEAVGLALHPDKTSTRRCSPLSMGAQFLVDRMTGAA